MSTHSAQPGIHAAVERAERKHQQKARYALFLASYAERLEEIQQQAREQRQQALDGGARYRGTTHPSSHQRNRKPDHPEPADRCQCCGSYVTKKYRRQFGDRHGLVWHCHPGCKQTPDCPDITASNMKRDNAGIKPRFDPIEDRNEHLGGGIYGDI